MEELLEEWVHYIPLDEDLANLQEQMEWVRANDEKASAIGQRGKAWIHDLLFAEHAAEDSDWIEDETMVHVASHFEETDELASTPWMQNAIEENSAPAVDADLQKNVAGLSLSGSEDSGAVAETQAPVETPAPAATTASASIAAVVAVPDATPVAAPASAPARTPGAGTATEAMPDAGGAPAESSFNHGTENPSEANANAKDSADSEEAALVPDMDEGSQSGPGPSVAEQDLEKPKNSPIDWAKEDRKKDVMSWSSVEGKAPPRPEDGAPTVVLGPVFEE